MLCYALWLQRQVAAAQLALVTRQGATCATPAPTMACVFCDCTGHFPLDVSLGLTRQSAPVTWHTHLHAEN
jgi:hypothetical protein